MKNYLGMLVHAMRSKKSGVRVIWEFRIFFPGETSGELHFKVRQDFEIYF